MTSIERLIKNGINALESSSYTEWLKTIVEDPNFRYSRLSIDDLRNICIFIDSEYVSKTDYNKEINALKEKLNAGQIETEELYEENRRLFLENKELKGE